jgi:uncharacterized membrane protein YfcA
MLPIATAAVAVAAGLLIGASLGAFGGGGAILTVPVLVYGLDQSPLAATTGSLVVVGVTAVIGAVTAYRAGVVLLGRGIAFGTVATAGALLGAVGSTHVDEDILLAAFAVLMLGVGLLMARKQWRSRHDPPVAAREAAEAEPILTFSPRFACQCPRALKVLVTATTAGLLTGFLGVGGGFLVVPALVLALRLPMRYAAGTSLVVIALTSATALAVRAGTGAQPDWAPVLLLTLASAVAAVLGVRLAGLAGTRRLSNAFTGLVLAVGLGTAAQAVPTMI